jgi:hypothetical protein
MTLSVDPTQLRLLRRFDDDWPFSGYPRLDHLSPSGLGKFVECPREWQQTYLQARPDKPAENLIVGSSFHRAMELNFRQKITTHVDLPVVELIAYHDDKSFDEVLGLDQEKAGEEIIWKTSYEDAKTRARLMIGEYRNQVCERIQPIAVEQTFEVPMGLPVKVQGRYDLLTAEVGIDWKSGLKKTYKPKTTWLLQALIYSFATGRPVEFHTVACTEDRHNVGIVTPLESEALLVNLSQGEVDGLTKVVLAIANEMVDCMRRYGPDGPWPARGRFHIFACDYCSFKGDCPAWMGAA